MLATVTASRLNIRAKPERQARILGTLNRGESIQITASREHWFEFRYQNGPAYVSVAYLNIHNSGKPRIGLVTASLLNVRTTASTSARVFAKLPKGSVVAVIAHHPDWLEIQLEQQTGFVAQRYIKLLQVDEPTHGTVTVNLLNVRQSPSHNGHLLGQLSYGHRVEVVQQLQDWLMIQFNGREAYVAAQYIKQQPIDETSDRIVSTSAELEAANTSPVLSEAPASLAPDRLLPVIGNREQQQTARTWNRYGSKLSELSQQLNLNTACAVAVLCVESGGHGFDRNNQNRLVIRFENHKFWKYWGKQNPERFNQHFRYDSQKVWLGHQWRPENSTAWQKFHGSQSAEWQVLQFARSLNNDAALLSISMGAPQIMGFHYQRLGFANVQAMFDAFSKDSGEQIQGLFDFLDQRMLQALQSQDFETFAGYYNGSGQKQKYGRWIQQHYQAFQQLQHEYLS